MTRRATAARADEFARLHRLFLEHFGHAVLFAWAAAIATAAYAPAFRNVRGLIDPTARPESTLSFLFALPALMSLAWISAAFGADILRRSQVAKSIAFEFAVAGAVAFAVFCMAIGRVVTVLSLAS